MDEDYIWLGENDEDECAGSASNESGPTFFNIELTQQGQPGGFHVHNFPEQRQRKAVSAFHGGSSKRPAFTVSCNAKAIIHGRMGPDSEKRGTLLAYEFKFNSYRGARIKEADILLEFHDEKGRAVGPSVCQVRPRGCHKMEETTQNQSSKLGLEITSSANVPGVDLGLGLTAEDSTEKVTKHYTIVTGDNPQSDDWGNFFQARFSLRENESQKNGIPSELAVCILLERGNDDDFTCVPYIRATPDFATVIASLFSSRAPDDPIRYSVEEAPYNELEKVDIDCDNLGDMKAKVNAEQQPLGPLPPPAIAIQPPIRRRAPTGFALEGVSTGRSGIPPYE